ncbi:MAG TPA: lysophospholipid acyltransferase family protein [Candidatus Acidoferrales bacterium]|nr:lysophospholipid acyltransferase family protein [Terriglobia bacterium]
MIRTLLLAFFFSFAVILALPWLVLWTILTGNPDFMWTTAMKAVRLGNRLAGIRVRAVGLENIPAQPCVFIANHASNVDPLVFIPAIPQRVGILVKRELFRIPIFSTAMMRAQFTPVDRGDRESSGKSISAAAEMLKEGLSHAIFAEGTRSPDGRLRPFKKGGFTMAIEAGAPIVPVSIAGTQRLLQKGSWIITPGEAQVTFGPAVNASEYTLENRPELIQRIESLVAAALPPDQQPLS